ncbi:HAD-IB family hydrolase [Campylobacter fetus]|uniref:HAD-IB family hydrolase n=3 Tax=Campylobacter fetus TaxID=196 RepID=A0A5L8UCK6_CAMFE|nr:HAD-IB family hydrolase [Campylobacter fetus]OCS21907.1 haloacid dehalogenase [Campylobacter fetus subsp. venerealis cfvi97/532]OCS26245.1 haloacid dehalogenase [Campylobacter fetus subsp. venerealis cfvB10]OCS29658.1 haloacid dehalogenase [Campylobacter fetus subsp. venerealis LMG 6570 = CCUG 33900]OCS43113.1 haloacid dehalogenase [Campylobacter fetus subsp. venerealis cfvi02/298]ABK81773.1 HAD-superfamily subfamily IB hydrolase [Campylobacter fetus subsp. fetus 82-40]
MIYLYDLDKTIIKEDSAKLWVDFMYENSFVGYDFVLKQAIFEEDYAKGVLDMNAYQEHFLMPLKGMKNSDLKPLLDRYIKDKIEPIIYKDALNLIDQNGGRKIVISATNDFIVKAICRFICIDEFLATNSEIINGVYSARMSGIPAFKEGKVKRIKELLSQDEFKDTVFYSDSINDLPLLKAAKIGVLVNPDDMLLEENKKLKFGVLKFKK